jgi:hypothetical protein
LNGMMTPKSHVRRITAATELAPGPKPDKTCF